MQSGARVQPGHTTAWLSEFCSAAVSLLGACHACKSVVPLGAASTEKRAAGISSGVQRRTQFCACWSAGRSAAVLPGVREHRCALSQADFLNHRLTDWRAVEWPLSEMRSQQRRFQAATAPAAAIGCQLEGKTRRQLLRILLHAFALLAVAASAAATHYPIAIISPPLNAPWAKFEIHPSARSTTGHFRKGALGNPVMPCSPTSRRRRQSHTPPRKCIRTAHY